MSEKRLPAPLWTGLGLVGPIGARVSGPLGPGVTGISIDTRTLTAGELFVAIKGDNDGHDHVRRAFEAGAAAAVIDEAHADALRGSGTLYVVRDTLAALENLGRAARGRVKARVIAVTGSVGKTTTKDALAMILGEQGPTHASCASYNNHWGVPLTLARMPAATRFGIFEIGMSHAGEITPLVAMVRPQVAIVTRVAPVHLEHFPSIEAIADAKAEIFSGIARGGAAILNRDDALFERLREHAQKSPASFVLGFGEHEKSDARLMSCDCGPDVSHVEADILGRRLTYTVGAPGRHVVMNTLAALLAVRAVGGDLDAASAALARLTPPAGRGARETLSLDGRTVTLIDESYNANPVSMAAAFDLLGATFPGGHGRRIAVLGDMLELGPKGAELHASLAADIARNGVDKVFASGPLMRSLYDALPGQKRGAYAETSAGLEGLLDDALADGDVVMVKGSNGSRMGPLVAHLRKIFAGESQLETA